MVCAAACPESGILDPSGPRRIDGDGTISLIKAARESGSVKQFVLVSSLGTGKFGLPGERVTRGGARERSGRQIFAPSTTIFAIDL